MLEEWETKKPCPRLNVLMETFPDCPEARDICARLEWCWGVWYDLVLGKDRTQEELNRCLWLMAFELPSMPLYQSLFPRIAPVMMACYAQLFDFDKIDGADANVLRRQSYGVISAMVSAMYGYNRMRRVGRIVTDKITLEELKDE